MGPMLFLIFINDIGNDISSPLRLFADDCLLFREIRNATDHQALQADLTKLVKWSNTWGMKFNISKCNILTITNKRKPSTFDYTMDGTILEKVQESVYLGVTLTSTLDWKSHVDRITSSANRILGFLWRNMHKCPRNLREKAFNSIVRSRLDFAATVWDPHHSCLTKKLENVQRRGARFVFNERYRKSLGAANKSPSEMLQTLNWPPLETRRKQQRLIIFHKTIHQKIHIPSSYLPNLKTRSMKQSRDHQTAFQTYHTNLNSFKFSYFPRTTQDWNALPAEVANTEDPTKFKALLQLHLKN